LYARVSTEQQTAADTIASQLAAVRERIEADGFALDCERCFVDDGYSGTTLLRPGLERLRDLAAAGEIDRLYVLAPDRLARRYAYQTLLVEELQRGGVAVEFVNRPLGQTAEDELLLQVQGVMAEYERAKLLERCRRGKRHSARRGSVSAIGKAPYGYRYVPHQVGCPACYEVIADEAQVVRRIFAWVGEERLSLSAVCQRLAEQGVPTRTGRPRWSRYSVYAILKHPAYQGMAQFGKTRLGERRPQLRPGRGRPEYPRQRASVYATPPEERIDIPVPPLVSAELFAAVAEQLRENRQRARQSQSGAQYLLQGLLVCTGCGYAWCGKRHRSRPRAGRPPRQYVYYGCAGTNPAQHEGRRLCRAPLLSAELLDQAVWQDVQALLADPEKIAREYQRRAQEQPTRMTAETAARDRQRRRLERSLARLIDAYTEGLLDKSEFEPRLRRFKERLAQLEAEARAAAAQLAQAEELRLAVGRLQDFARAIQEGLKTVDWNMRREIIRTLVKQIEVGDQEVRVIYRVAPNPFVKGPQGGHLQDCSRCHAMNTPVIHRIQGVRQP
jgi:site-specific DNA recombinase